MDALELSAQGQALGRVTQRNGWCSFALIFAVFKIRIVFSNAHIAAEQRAYMLTA